jgi:hypothetical protein
MRAETPATPAVAAGAVAAALDAVEPAPGRENPPPARCGRPASAGLIPLGPVTFIDRRSTA